MIRYHRASLLASEEGGNGWEELNGWGRSGGKDIPAKGYRIRMMGDLEGDDYGEGV